MVVYMEDGELRFTVLQGKGQFMFYTTVLMHDGRYYWERFRRSG